MDEFEDLPMPDVTVESLDPDELRERIESGEKLTVLDVRAAGEYEEWHIEGENVDISNVPYYEFIEGVDDDLLARVPEAEDGPLIAVCAKGGASEYVAGVLKEQGIDAVNLAEGMNGWARIYETVAVSDAPGPATVLQLQRPSSGCLAYVIHDGGEAAVVDPLRAFTDYYVDLAEDLGVSIEYVVDTHVHADHVSGLRELRDRTGARSVVSTAAMDRGIEYEVDVPVEHGDVFHVGEATVEVVFTPGHTSGMTSYLVDDTVLMTGDCLFVESVARPDLEKGDEGAPDAAGQLYDTIHDRVLSLPDGVVVAPGHFSDSAETADDGTYTARLGDLRERMTALQKDREAFVEFMLADMPPRPSNFEEIIATNLGKKDVDDETAFELELGPNNCAATQKSIADD